MERKDFSVFFSFKQQNAVYVPTKCLVKINRVFNFANSKPQT